MAVSVISLGLDVSVIGLNGLAVTQDGQYLFGAGGLGTIYRWDISDNALEAATTWETTVNHVNDVATDASFLYILDESTKIYKTPPTSPSLTLLHTMGSGDICFDMVYGNSKLYVGGYHDNGVNYIARVWEINTTTGAQTTVSEFDQTLPWGVESNAYSDLQVASDGAIWAVKSNDKVWRGIQGSAVPATAITLPTLPQFRGEMLPASSGGNMYYFNATGVTQKVISPAGVASSITLNLFISHPNVMSAATNDITTCRVIGWEDGNANQLAAWKVFDVETIFSLAQSRRTHSLLTYPCTYGDAKTAFHYGDELFPDDEVVFTSPHSYPFNWSTRLGGTPDVMTVYSDGSNSWAQVLTISSNGAITYGEPRELDIVVDGIDDAWMNSYDPNVGLLSYMDDDDNLTIMVIHRIGQTVTAISSTHSSLEAHRLSATTLGTTLMVAYTGALTLGLYPVYVVPVTVSSGTGGITTLSAADEADFENWMISQGFTFENGYNVDEDFNGLDYDYRGFWLEFGNVVIGPGQHLTDTYKLPTHDTFSDESAYATGGFAQYAGFWSGINHDIYNPPATPYTGDYEDVVASLGTTVTFGTPVNVGDSSLGYTYAPHITSLGNQRFIVRHPASTASSRFRHGILSGDSISLSPNAYTFSWDSQDLFFLGVGRTRAINGSMEGGVLQFRVIDVNTSNNAVTTQDPFHSETSNIPVDEVGLIIRATDRTILVAWHIGTGIRVCHIQFPLDGGLELLESNDRLFLRNLK